MERDMTGTWAVHGLEAELLLLNVHQEHVVLVVLCVAAALPQLKVEQVGRHHLFIAVLPVLLPNQLHRERYVSRSLNAASRTPLDLDAQVTFEATRLYGATQFAEASCPK